MPRGAAVGAVGLNSLATAITHLALLAGALLIAPSALDPVREPARRPGGPAMTGPVWHGWGVALAIGLLCLVLGPAVTVRRPRRWLVRRSRAALSAIARMVRDMRQLTRVLRHPGRAAALWLGSASLPLFHTLILFAVLRSLGVSLTIGTVLVIYVGVSALTSLLPSPGAIGGLDVALIAGLTATGASSAVAVGAVLGYRMITVWLPLLPAACAFAVVLRRRII
ncbi:MAG: YbhN family protein [Actinoallomurus sp.]